jgi:hypothetical protein
MRNDGILPAFACLKIVILETVNMLASSSAVKARPIRSIRSGSDIGCPAPSETRTLLEGACKGLRASDTLQRPQSFFSCLVCGILPRLDTRQSFAQLAVSKARVILGQLGRQDRFQRRRLVCRRR